MTSRWPVRPDVSSRMSAMPASLPSLTISAIFSARLSGLTMYGRSGAHRQVRPRLPAAAGAARRRVSRRAGVPGRVVGVPHVPQLGDHQAGAPLDLLDLDPGPHGDGPA